MTRDLLVVQIPLLEKVLRTIAVYLFLVLALRLAGKRELAQLKQTGQAVDLGLWCAPRGIRTPNRQIRRLVLYVHAVSLSAVGAAQVRSRFQPDHWSAVW
jgi:hypothetical protein